MWTEEMTTDQLIQLLGTLEKPIWRDDMDVFAPGFWVDPSDGLYWMVTKELKRRLEKEGGKAVAEDGPSHDCGSPSWVNVL